MRRMSVSLTGHTADRKSPHRAGGKGTPRGWTLVAALTLTAGVVASLASARWLGPEVTPVVGAGCMLLWIVVAMYGEDIAGVMMQDPPAWSDTSVQMPASTSIMFAIALGFRFGPEAVERTLVGVGG